MSIMNSRDKLLAAITEALADERQAARPDGDVIAHLSHQRSRLENGASVSEVAAEVQELV